MAVANAFAAIKKSINDFAGKRIAFVEEEDKTYKLDYENNKRIKIDEKAMLNAFISQLQNLLKKDKELCSVLIDRLAVA